MSHWALIDENNFVTMVTVGDNGSPDEGYSWLKENAPGNWIKTSYNTYSGIHLNGGIPFRKNFAGVGFYYDSVRDAFIPPKPFNSWILNEDTCQWNPPVDMPNDENYYFWDEESTSWKIR